MRYIIHWLLDIIFCRKSFRFRMNDEWSRRYTYWYAKGAAKYWPEKKVKWDPIIYDTSILDADVELT